MKRLTVLLSFLLFCPAVLAASAPDRAKVAATLQESFPKLTVDEVNECPLPGILEIVSGDRIFYYAPASGHLLVGNLISKEGENITGERLEEIMAKRIKDLPLTEALKIGTGPHQVIEVTDPDCGYCRKGSHFLDGRKDVTRHIFFKPLGMHPQARAKAAYILSAADPTAAYHEILSGKYDSQPLPAFKDNGQLERQSKAVDRLGVNSTPAYWIDGHYVGGSDLRLMQQLLELPLTTAGKQAQPKK